MMLEPGNGFYIIPFRLDRVWHLGFKVQSFQKTDRRVAIETNKKKVFPIMSQRLLCLLVKLVPVLLNLLCVLPGGFMGLALGFGV